MQQAIRPFILALCLCLALGLNERCAFADSKFDQAVELYKQKRYDVAAKSFAELATVESRNPAVYYYQANCQYAMGHRQAAIKFYSYVANQFSTSKEAYYAKTILKQIDSSNAGKSDSTSSGTESASLNKSSGSKPSKEQLIEHLVKVVRSQGNRPNVSTELVGEVKKALDRYPTSLLVLLLMKRCDICLTPSTIDQDPRMQNTKPTGYEEGSTFKNCPGFFDGRHLVICQYAAYGSDDSDWRPTQDPIGTLRHELGHAFDHCLGSVSESEEFKHAYYLDLGQIEEEQKPHLAYFMQVSRNGPAETFAELSCYQFGGREKYQDRCALVHSAFKQSAQAVTKLLSQAGHD